MKCQVCGGDRGVRHRAREMMFGTRDEFEYFECAACGCLQLATPPADMGKYYPANYYSFQEREPTIRQPRGGRIRRWVASRRNEAQLFRRGGAWGAVAALRPNPLMRLPYGLGEIPGLRFTSRILDVGCGAGHLLANLADLGFTDLSGADPYLAGDRTIGGRVHLRAVSVEGIDDGSYDLIMLHHSLEHIPDQWSAMKAVARLLKPNGTCLVRIPTATSTVWRHYGVDWVELDAPRHYVLHSHDSLKKLAVGSGLQVTRITCDDDGIGYWGSEMYRKGLSLFDPALGRFRDPASVFSPDELTEFRTKAERDNQALAGGRIVAFLRPDARHDADRSRSGVAPEGRA